MKKLTGLVILLLNIFGPCARAQKTLNCSKTKSKITIDANLNEAVWQDLQVATNFLMLIPDNGSKAPEEFKNKVKITYDDTAIYLAAELFYDKNTEVKKEFSSRDNMHVEADVFTFSINPFNDGVNEVKFHVSAAGVQADSKTSKSGDDFSWNAVWESAVKINSDKWCVEIKIPYSALRFQNTKHQTWGINFTRNIKSVDQIYTWNFVDRTIGREAQYNGMLTGITNIKPPVRLSFFPFVSTTSKIGKNSESIEFNTGLDLKYGISESFTLDATLIPDFGQTALDELKLNLGPYEQTYSEQRQFFIEGMELLNKGNLFYSRRIGEKSSARRKISENETVDIMPSEVKILNVFKISGRNNKGLGVGFLNAITRSTTANITNSEDSITKEETIDPFTNYNVISIDQQFNNNSSISFVNTNVLRQGHFRDANATALAYDLSNSSNSYKIDGDVRMSNINDTENIQGFSSRFNLRKIAGNFRFRIHYNLTDDKFDINDLGKQRKNNYHYLNSYIKYEKFTPQGRFNNYKISLDYEIQKLYNPFTYVSSSLGINSLFTTQKLLTYAVSVYINPKFSNDYNITRTHNRFLVKNRNFYLHTRFNSDSGRKLYINTSLTFNDRLHDNENTYKFVLRPRIRLSDKFNINYSFKKKLTRSQAGYIENNGDEILFGRRKIDEIENNIKFGYNYNVKHSASLKLRNYWTKVKYDEKIFTLSEEGGLDHTQLLAVKNPNRNFNTWNFDFRYSWLFAPGSEMMFLYRNSIQQNTNNADKNYSSSLNDLFAESLNHTISLKITYYIDYNNMKRTISKILHT